MWPLILFLVTWVYLVALTYVILYYESANGSHLEVLRSRGPVYLLMVRGFLSTLLSHVLVVAAALTGLYRGYWHPPLGPVTRPPVIFVHGLYHNRTAWFFYLHWFRRWGWRHLKAITLRGTFRPVAEHATTLAHEVDEVLRQTGSTSVDLVGHSMGGLVIRAFVAQTSNPSVVRTIVTLGTPHAGSKLAVFAVGKVRRDLLPGSPFLASLNAQGAPAPRNGRLYAIYSIVDNMVLPNESARAGGEGVTCLETGPVNHVGLLFSRRTAELVRKCLDEDRQHPSLSRREEEISRIVGQPPHPPVAT
jgi:pimeloyl-ACP methyl ester carboxylesterase